MKSITFLLLLLCSVSPAAFCQQSYIIEGHVSGLPDSAVIRLLQNEGSLLKGIGTDTVRNGKFRFTGTAGALTALAITGEGEGFPSQWLEIWAKPGSRILISGKGPLLKSWTVKSDIPQQKDQQRFMNYSRRHIDVYQELSVQDRILFEKIRQADKETRPALKKSLDSLRGLQDSINDIIARDQLTQLAAAKQHSDYWMGVLYERARFSKYSKDTTLLVRTKQLYDALPAAEKSSVKGKEIASYLYPPVVVKVGEKMADTELKDLAGKKYQLADFKGKYLLIDFWSIGCGPCIAAMPELKKLHESAPANLAVISLSLDQSEETWKAATAHVKMDWTNLSDGKGMAGLAANYGVTGIPHYIIISPEGVLLESWVGYSEGDLEKKISKFVQR